jgi:CRP/FNR family transcriptional regulator
MSQNIHEQKILSLFPAFQALPPCFHNKVINDSKCISIYSGSVVFESNSPCRAFPLLLYGSIRVVSIGENGRELLLYRVKPGEFCVLSTSCLLNNADYPATGIAETDLLMVMLNHELFNMLIEYHQPFRTLVFSLFSKRLSDLMYLVEEIAFFKLNQRLATLLLRKGNKICTTHQQLANELGSVREIISRLLQSFEAEGLISLSREQIQVLDSHSLRKLASPHL